MSVESWHLQRRPCRVVGSESEEQDWWVQLRAIPDIPRWMALSECTSLRIMLTHRFATRRSLSHPDESVAAGTSEWD